jgi:hypothetical protein
MHREKRRKKIAEKLALHQEKERMAKETEDAKAHIALVSKILESKFGGNIASLLPSGLQLSSPPASCSMPTPILVCILLVALLIQVEDNA